MTTRMTAGERISLRQTRGALGRKITLTDFRERAICHWPRKAAAEIDREIARVLKRDRQRRAAEYHAMVDEIGHDVSVDCPHCGEYGIEQHFDVMGADAGNVFCNSCGREIENRRWMKEDRK